MAGHESQQGQPGQVQGQSRGGGSDLDSDNEDTNKMTPLANGSSHLTRHGMHTPNSRDKSSRGGGGYSSKPMLIPSASQ